MSPQIPHFRAHDRSERVPQARVLHRQLPQTEARTEPDAMVRTRLPHHHQDRRRKKKDGGFRGGVHPGRVQAEAGGAYWKGRFIIGSHLQVPLRGSRRRGRAHAGRRTTLRRASERD